MSIEGLIREKYAAEVQAAREQGTGAARINAPAHMLSAQAAMTGAQTGAAEVPIRQQLANTNQFNAVTDRMRGTASAGKDRAETNALNSQSSWLYGAGSSGNGGNMFGGGTYRDAQIRNVPGPGAGNISASPTAQPPGLSSSGMRGTAGFSGFSGDMGGDRSAGGLTRNPYYKPGGPEGSNSFSPIPGDNGEDSYKTFKRGTARVPGKGSGKVDKVPAMLAPGEAVLNKAAADKAGRGNIAALNRMGAQKMGLGMRGSDEMRHYATGTAYVDPNEASRNAFFQQQMAPAAPAFDAAIPRIDHGPAPGIPNRPAPMPAGPPMPPQPPMSHAGWAAPLPPTMVAPPAPPPSAFMQAQLHPTGPAFDAALPRIDHGPTNMGVPNRPAPTPPSWDQDFLDRHPTMPPAAMMPEQPYIPGPPPVMQPRGFGMLGSERARGGLSAFEKAFAANRKAGASTFNFGGKPYSTKLAGER